MFGKLFNKKSTKRDEKQRPTSVGGARAGTLKEDAANASASVAVANVDLAPKTYVKPVKELSRNIEFLKEILEREQGTVMDRIAPGRKPQEVCVCFNPKTFLISWYAGNTKGKPGTHIGQVDVAEMKEVRSGPQAANTKDFKAGVEGPNQDRDKFAICILYGTEFRLKMLCFYARNQDEVLAWTEGLYFHTQNEHPELYNFPKALSRWIEKHWSALDRQFKQSIVSKDVRVWLQRINFKLSPKDIKDYFQMVDRLKQTFIGIEELTDLYHILVDIPALTDEFARFASLK